jgi:hypothetical protein
MMLDEIVVDLVGVDVVVVERVGLSRRKVLKRPAALSRVTARPE